MLFAFLAAPLPRPAPATPVFLANDNAAAPALVARGEITLKGRTFAYEYRSEGVYWLRRGSGSRREFFATLPDERARGQINICRAGDLSFLSLCVDSQGRLVVSR